MRVDKSQSAFSEIPEPRTQFTRTEIKHSRMLLRRLQFLEHKVRINGGLANGGDDGGGAYAEWERDALEWALKDIGFIVIDESKRTD